MESIQPLEKIFSVSEYIEFLNQYLRPVESVVQGEVGEKISKYPNFAFFNLIDTTDKSSIQCFVTAPVLRALGGELAPGMEIRVEGHAGVFKKNGGLNLQVSRIIPVGEGALKQQFELLRKKLKEEGYFNVERKKKIPQFVSAIGLITSKVGRGAKKDFLTHLGNFGFKIAFYPSKVEGAFAVRELIAGIEYLNKEYPMLQAIVITRGGGSWESLQAFNSEELVKAIAASNIPIIMAVGHEDDVTLADYVADARASTPTHAARMLSEPWARADDFIVRAERYLGSQMGNRIRRAEELFIRFKSEIPRNIISYIQLTRTRIAQPLLLASGKMAGMKQKTEYGEELIKIRMRAVMTRYVIAFTNFEHMYALASPTLKLKQGYSITRTKEGKIIKSIHDVNEGDVLHTQLANGSIDATITTIHNDGKKI